MSSSRETEASLLVREVCQVLKKAQSEKRPLTAGETNLIQEKLERIDSLSSTQTATSGSGEVSKLFRRGAVGLVAKGLYDWLFEND